MNIFWAEVCDEGCIIGGLKRNPDHGGEYIQTQTYG